MSSLEVIFLIVVVLALMAGSFWLGRYFALTYEIDQGAAADAGIGDAPDQSDRLPGPPSREFKPRGAPPPVLAGPSPDGGAGNPEPHGTSRTYNTSSAPKRSARPPAAAAAWDADKEK